MSRTANPSPAFRIVMRQTITDPAERQRRLTLAFDAILSFDSNEIASTPKPAKTQRIEAEDTPLQMAEPSEFTPDGQE